MGKERGLIAAKIIANDNKIKQLRMENLELKRKALLLSDEVQRFEEKEEEIEVMMPVPGSNRKKKVVVTRLLGRVHYVEDFIDEDTKEVVSVNRSRIVKIDGVFI